MSVRATVLCENSIFGTIGALAEHGWAVWIETSSGNYLFDTGYKSLLENAAFFDVDLATVDAILISHHHVDHTGGLLGAVKAATAAPGRNRVDVYSHFDLFKPSYSVEPGKEIEYIGIPHCRAALEGAGANLCVSDEWREVGEGLYLTGRVPRLTDFEKDDCTLKHLDSRGDLVTDPVVDDQSLVIETDQGLFVVLGCSHSGIINTLNHISKKSGHSRFHTVIGGTHLGYADEEQIDRTIDALSQWDIQRLGVSHCTGNPASMRLANVYGERFLFCNIGTKIFLCGNDNQNSIFRQ